MFEKSFEKVSKPPRASPSLKRQSFGARSVSPACACLPNGSFQMAGRRLAAASAIALAALAIVLMSHAGNRVELEQRLQMLTECYTFEVRYLGLFGAHDL